MTLIDKRQRVRTDQAIHVTRRLVGTQIAAQCENREQIPFHGPIQLGVRAGNGIKMAGEVRPALHVEQNVQKIAHRHPMDDGRLEVDGGNGDLPVSRSSLLVESLLFIFNKFYKLRET